MLTGQLAPFFWCQIACYAAAIALALLGSKGKRAFVTSAGAFAIVGALCKRLCMMIGGFQVANIPLETTLTPDSLINWQDGMYAAYTGLVYTPTAPEIGLFVGTAGIVALLALIGLKRLPVL